MASFLLNLLTLPTGRTLDDKYPGTRQYGARFALQIFFSLNLLNFADRYVPSAVKTLYADELGLSDFESSLPFTGMVVVFMVSAMIFGLISDKDLIDRRFVLCFGIIFWSLATALAGLATNLVSLIILRSLVGVGEAAYGTICPPMVGDFYPEKERNVAYGIYYLAIPLGGAVGFGIGSFCGSLWGWRVAFYICGIPGILASFLILRINNPVRGINDARHTTQTASSESYKEIVTTLNPVTANDPTLEPVADPPSTSDSAVEPYKSPAWPNDEQENVQAEKEETAKANASMDVGILWGELWELLSNPAYMLATAGLIASESASLPSPVTQLTHHSLTPTCLSSVYSHWPHSQQQPHSLVLTAASPPPFRRQLLAGRASGLVRHLPRALRQLVPRGVRAGHRRRHRHRGHRRHHARVQGRRALQAQGQVIVLPRAGPVLLRRRGSAHLGGQYSLASLAQLPVHHRRGDLLLGIYRADLGAVHQRGPPAPPSAKCRLANISSTHFG